MTIQSLATSPSPVARGYVGDRLLWRSLQQDHDQIWDMINFLTGGPGEPEGTEHERRKMALRLVAVESAHEAAEELVIWPAVRRLVPEGHAMVSEALSEEREAKRLFNEFRHIKPGALEFEECLNAISGTARAHITYEQNQIWPALESALSPAEADELGRAWLRERRRAPTRPHPHTPPAPGVLAGVGRVAALVDRARDLIVLRDRV
jgi:hemerythrin-like domain-containing protein